MLDSSELKEFADDNNIFQDSFNKILSQRLIHDRSYEYNIVLRVFSSCLKSSTPSKRNASPGWLSDERVGLMTWWL